MHNLYVYTSESLLKRTSGEATVSVVWQVQFDRELDGYFNKRKYKHDYDLFKQGVGNLTVNFRYDSQLTVAENLAYVEVLAAKHIVSNTGLNAFGFTDDNMSIRRDHLNVVFSKPDAVKLMLRKGIETSYFDRLGAISSKTSPPAGYLYGASAESTASHDWLMPYITNDKDFDFYNTAYDLDIRENDYVFTSVGSLIVDFRSVDEFMMLDWTQYQIQVKNQEISRPFEVLVDLLKGAGEMIYTNNNYLAKIKRLFGDDSFLLLNREKKSWLPITPIAGVPGTYLVLGLRRYYNPANLAEMHEHGFALSIKQSATEDEIQEIKDRRQRLNEERQRK
ncbi:hypothetical protein [Enterovibrio norvegicus]|uniref:hypothetical protein n=1 Tax=Enterovibrio norvegicus TaxID=188144 RepID=UPI000C82C954|nr:hypothetical protein [Enterovibrio norvegicus]PMH64575.1 hypothetical protein BCU62_16090 [Enterovibrio norvegicus]